MSLSLLGLLVNAILELHLLLFVFDRLLLLLKVGGFALLSHRFELVVQLFLLAAEKLSFLFLLLSLELPFFLSICPNILCILAFLLFFSLGYLLNSLFSKLLTSFLKFLGGYLCFGVIFFLKHCILLFFLSLFDFQLLKICLELLLSFLTFSFLLALLQ